MTMSRISRKAIYLGQSLLFLFFFLSSVKCYTFNKFEIRDLEETTSYFNTEALPWVITNRVSSQNTSFCSGMYILGGYGVTSGGGTFTRTYTSLPPHTVIHFSILLWILDLEEVTDLFQIYFDGQLLRKYDTKGYSPTSFSSGNICGGSKLDYSYVSITAKVPHSGSQLVFKVISLDKKPKDTFYIGFRNLNFLFKNTTSPTLTACDFVSTSSSTFSCLCPMGYFDGAGSAGCQSCSLNCNTCLSSSSGDCASCKLGYSFNGVGCSQCHSSCMQCNGPTATNCLRCYSTSFLYPNGTCLSNCPAPYIQKSEGMYKSCLFPCSSSQFLYPNNTCLSTCAFPYVQRTDGSMKFCDEPCPTSSFLYWNGSCVSTCPLSFQSSINGIKSCNFYCEKPLYLLPNKTCSPTCNLPYQTSLDSQLYQFCNLPCPAGMYYYQNDSCLSQCNGLVTNFNGISFCDFPCATNEYLYQNNTCQTNCNSPFGPRLEGTWRYCDPLCPASSFLYWNGSCLPTCPLSFQATIDGQNVCNFHCDTSNYLYWNQSCASTCNIPYKKSIDSQSYKFCSLPCPSGMFYYQNGTCLSQCNNGLQSIIDGVTYCDYPCEANMFLYQDNTCRDICESPYIVNVVDDYLKLCRMPCSPAEFFKENDGTCISDCASPSTIKVKGLLKICVPASTSSDQSLFSQIVFEQKFYVLTNIAQELVVGASYAGGVLRPNDRNSVFMIALAKLLKYVAYINVPLSKETKIAFKPINPTIFSLASIFSFEMPESFKVMFQKNPLPEVFEDKNVHSSYLVNQWKSLSSFLILLLIGIFFTLLETWTAKTKFQNIHLLFARLKTITKWNFLLIIFFNSYDDLTLFAILEFYSLNLDSFLAFLSFFVCIGMTVFSLYVLWKALKIAKEAVNHKNKVIDINLGSHDISFVRKWQAYQVIYAGFKDETLLKQAYVFIFTSRVIICYIIVGCLHFSPFTQTLLLSLLSFFAIFHLIRQRPLKLRFNFFVILVFESLVMTVNLCLFILTILNINSEEYTDTMVGLGKTVLICNTIVEVCSNVFMWVYVLLGLARAYFISRNSGNYGKTVWLNVLLVPYQNPGMEFDFENHPHMETQDNLEKQKPKESYRKFRRVQPMTSFIAMPGESDAEPCAQSKKETIRSHFKFPSSGDNMSDTSQIQSNYGSPLPDKTISNLSTKQRVSPPETLVEPESGDIPDYMALSVSYPSIQIDTPQSENRELMNGNQQGVSLRKIYNIRPKAIVLTKNNSSKKKPPSTIFEEAPSGTKREDSEIEGKSLMKLEEKYSKTPLVSSQKSKDYIQKDSLELNINKRKFRLEHLSKDEGTLAHINSKEELMSPVTTLKSPKSLTIPNLSYCVTLPTEGRKIANTRVNLLNLLSKRKIEEKDQNVFTIEIQSPQKKNFQRIT